MIKRFKNSDVLNQELRDFLKKERALTAFIQHLNIHYFEENKDLEQVEFIKRTLSEDDCSPYIFVRGLDFYLVKAKKRSVYWWNLHVKWFKQKTGKDYI